MNRAVAKRRPAKLSIDLTINLANGDEIDVEGTADSLSDLGPAVERIIREDAGMDAHERWTSLVVVVVA